MPASLGAAHELNVGPFALPGHHRITDIPLDGEERVAIGGSRTCPGDPPDEENTVVAPVVADVIPGLGHVVPRFTV